MDMKGLFWILRAVSKPKERFWKSEENIELSPKNSLAAIFIHQKNAFVMQVVALRKCSAMTRRKEIVGKPFWVVVHPEDRHLVKERGLKRKD